MGASCGKTKVYSLVKSSELKFIEFNTHSPDLEKRINDIKSVIDTICSCQSKKSGEEVRPDYIDNKINDLKEDEKKQLFCLSFYGKYTIERDSKIRESEKPVAILIGRENKMKNAYIIYIFCRHPDGPKGCGMELMKILEERGKTKGFTNIFLEGFPGAREDYYLKRGFDDDDKSLFTESPTEPGLYSLSKPLRSKYNFLKTYVYKQKIKLPSKNSNQIVHNYLSKYHLVSLPELRYQDKYQVKYNLPLNDKMYSNLIHVCVENELGHAVLALGAYFNINLHVIVLEAKDEYIKNLLMSTIERIASQLNVNSVYINNRAVFKVGIDLEHVTKYFNVNNYDDRKNQRQRELFKELVGRYM